MNNVDNTKKSNNSNHEISKDIEQNRAFVLRRIEGCADILYRPMKLGVNMDVKCFLIYIEIATSNMMLQDSVIGKLLNHLWEMDKAQVLEAVRNNSLGISDTKELPDMKQAFAAMLAGNVVMFVDGFDRAIKISSKGYPGSSVQKAESEKVLRGSKEAFGEFVKMNTGLIRKRIRDTRMKVEEITIGERSKTMNVLVYMPDLVYPEVLESIRGRLKSFSIDGIMDSGVIEQLTEDTWYSPFPQYQTTERPDKAAMAVLEGRVVLLSDNSPEALILPTTMNSIFQTSDDYYRHFAIVSFLRLIRYVAAVLAVTLPGLYIAVTTFHTQVVPTPLLLSLAEARAGVPFPAVVEVLFLELAFQLLLEAGLRMPGPIGSTIGIVGGLIIGQAAVSASIVSPVVVVVVALTALGSFSVPNEEFSEALELIKYGMILLAAFLGIPGLFFGCYLLIVHLAKLKSFGIPYLTPMWRVR